MYCIKMSVTNIGKQNLIHLQFLLYKPYMPISGIFAFLIPFPRQSGLYGSFQRDNYKILKPGYLSGYMKQSCQNSNLSKTGQ